MIRTLALAVTALLPQVVMAQAVAAPSGTYVNPVSAPVADTFADPAVIRGKDGRWYAFGTSDPLREGERTHRLMPILRSDDLVSWSYLGDVFGPANRPAWATAESRFWAPDIRYADGRYLLYFTATDTTANPGDDSAVGVATAPTPAGPWTDSGAPVVAPRPAPFGGFLWTFDPAMITDLDGRHWLYYGSYFGGIFTVPLTADGLRVAGAATQMAIDNRYEGSYVVHHDGWYYLFASAANCCAGPTTGYSVFAGRSRSPAGPFVDRDGVPLLTSRVGGTPVVQPNGNSWVGTGHNAVVTDDAGQDWLVYHAINRVDPYLDEPFGINERPMLLDRLDWIDGWPTVRAGAWASEDRERAPVTSADRFEGVAMSRDWRPSPGWTVLPDADPDSGGLLRHTGPGLDTLEATRPLPPQAHVVLDVRVASGAAGVALGSGMTVLLDRAAGALTTSVAGVPRSTPFPAGFRYDAWHTLTVHLADGVLTAAVTDARLHDPVAVQSRDVPKRPIHVPETADTPGIWGLVARGGADFDNVSAVRAARLVERAEPEPRVGPLLSGFSDDFEGGLGAGWTWVRPDPAATVTDGALRWPTQASDLVGGGNTASILLRDAPRGDYIVETKLTIDLGVDTVRNFEQAGLIAYVDDDNFARLSHVAIWNTRQVEFGRELRFAGATTFGGMVLTAPADTTWLRLAHTIDHATGEHEFRAASSRDGLHWTWGGTWTFPAGTTPRIGLISHGGNTPPATALLDYFHVYRS
jgi:arabinan endo-1,5-alpha-L-arabinosidase